MVLARSLPGGDNAAELSAAIDQWMISQYVDLIQDLRDADRDVLAQELLEEATADYPESERLADLKSAAGS